MDTEDGIFGITYYGKGRMPASCRHPPFFLFTIEVFLLEAAHIRIYNLPPQGFGEKCTPKGQCTFGARLQDEEIKLLAEFVRLQADRGWPNIESYGD